MKIVINTPNVDIFNSFVNNTKLLDIQLINAKVESILFDYIENQEADAYILSTSNQYFKRAVDFIKKTHAYVPIIGIIDAPTSFDIKADIYICLPSEVETEIAQTMFVEATLHNIQTYTKTFLTLRKLTAKAKDKIKFANCIYDPTRRTLFYKGKEIKKLSGKEGGIVEILASNYGKIVKKEVILEKVWRKTDYYAGRSMDVYITNLRNTFKKNKIKLTIKNISGVGLILE